MPGLTPLGIVHTGPEDSRLLALVGVAFVLFVIGAITQALRIRSEPKPALVRASR